MAENDTTALCINSVLPDEIIEEILSMLPLKSIGNVIRVCTKWNEIVIHSPSFPNRFIGSPSSRKPWYLSLTSIRHRPREYLNKVYDQTLGRWHTLNFPFPASFSKGKYTIASSSGLICCMISSKKRPILLNRDLYVCNPITQLSRRLPDFPSTDHVSSWGLTMSEGRAPGSYVVVVVTIKHIQYNVAPVSRIRVHMYSSEKMAWETREEVFLPILRYYTLPFSCVICDEVLYFPCTGDSHEPGYLCAYDVRSGCCFAEGLIPFPSYFKCSNLVNMKGKVAMVGLCRNLRNMHIWLLGGREWTRAAALPVKELIYTVKYSSGFDGTIYIQDQRLRKLVIVDVVTGHWRQANGWLSSNIMEAMAGTYFEPLFGAIP